MSRSLHLCLLLPSRMSLQVALGLTKACKLFERNLFQALSPCRAAWNSCIVYSLPYQALLLFPDGVVAASGHQSIPHQRKRSVSFSVPVLSHQLFRSLSPMTFHTRPSGGVLCTDSRTCLFSFGDTATSGKQYSRAPVHSLVLLLLQKVLTLGI